MKASNYIKAIAEVIWMILVPLVLANGLWYLLGAFIAWDFNPMHWWLFNTTFGRVIAIILELCIISAIPDFWESK
jgi:FtsH-binding integral membrane protein